MTTLIKSGLLAIVLGSTTLVVHAADVQTQNEALNDPAAKISLSRAISIAEGFSKGRATRAEYERSERGWVYDVEVVGANKVFDVKVDASTGAVISSAEDRADCDDEHEDQD